MVHLRRIMKEKNDKINLDVKFIVEDVVGCKWALSIIDMISKGIHRPGAMSREQDGLTTKVLNERLRKLIKYKILKKVEYAEVPPRVEYHFTEFGLKFLNIVIAIQKLEEEVTRETN